MAKAAVPDEPTPRAKPRTLDPELQCMAKIDRLLAELSCASQGRVLAWLQSRYSYVSPQETNDQSGSWTDPA